MKNAGEFLILRYSLVEENQTALETTPLPIPKGAAVKAAISNDIEYTRNNVTYAFVGFTEVKSTKLYQIDNERYLVGKIAKLRKAKVGEKVPGDIIAHEEDDWIPLVTIFDIHEQYIFVQKHWKFGNEKQIANAIEEGLKQPILSTYNHRVFIKAKTKKSDFWSVISNHKKVYRLELNLISPNILDTNRKARDVLEQMKLLYGQDEMSLVLENDSGSLIIPEEPIADYIDYAAEGEGKWTLITEGNKGGKKKHTSEEAGITLDLNIPTEEEIYHEGQLELETGLPAPGREQNDASIVAEIAIETSKLKRKNEDD